MASVLNLFGRCSSRNTLTSCQKLVPIADCPQGFPQISLTFIRWRKPRWVPKAPSKIYYVRKPTPIDPIEHEQLMKMYNEYRCKMKAVRSFLGRWVLEERMPSVDMVTTDQETELAQLLEKNRLWNEEVAKQRDERQSDEAAKMKQKLDAKLEKLAILNTKSVAAADEAIRKQMELVGTFITPDILEDEIDKMLNSRKDYNFAINMQGDHVHLHDTLPAKGATTEQQSTGQQNEENVS